jgi:hypothetical protein
MTSPGKQMTAPDWPASMRKRTLSSCPVRLRLLLNGTCCLQMQTQHSMSNYRRNIVEGFL